MIRINLLPVREKVKEENIRRQITLGVLIVVLAVAVMGVLWFQQYQHIGWLEDETARLTKKREALKREVGDINKLKKEKEALERRKQAIADLNKNRLSTVKVLDILSANKPPDLYFVNVDQKSEVPWGNFFLSIKGMAIDNEVVAEFMKKLQTVETFAVVDLDYIKAKKTKGSGQEGLKEFRITIQVNLSPQEPGAQGAPETKEKSEKGLPGALAERRKELEEM